MDFQNKIEKVDTFSIAYYYRGDFARWIRDVIGDSALTSELSVKGKSTLK